MDAYIIIEEVPYRLNVVSGNIALSLIAVELSKASALGKKNTHQSVHRSRFHLFVLQKLLVASRGMAGLLNSKCQISIPLIRIAGSTVKPL